MRFLEKCIGARFASASVAALALCNVTAQAQTAAQSQVDAPPQESAGASIGEIVVTAERRASTVQKTPIAITAISGDSLGQSGITDISGLDDQIPNLTFEQNSGAALIFIRGIGYSSIAPGGETRVALYSDGIYQSRTQAALLGFYDIDRVEVLRGPQGTLYGRNAIAGTINLITREPTSNVEGYITATAGTYDLLSLEGGVGGPLGSNVEGRIAFRAVERDGYGKNIGTGQDVSDESSRSVRGKLNFEPASNLSIKLVGDYTLKDDHNGGYIFVGAANPNVVPLGLRLPDSEAPTKPYDSAGLGPSLKIETYGFAGQLDWDLSDETSLTLLSGYRHLESFLTNSVDGFTSNLSLHYVTEESKTFSQEIRLSQQIGNFANLIVGGYYFHETNSVLNEAAQKGIVFANAFGLGGVLDPGQQYEFFGTFGRVKTDAYALFGQVNIRLAEGLGLDLGARYSDETKSLFEQKQLDLTTPFIQGNALTAVFDPARGQLGGEDRKRERWTSFDPKATISYQVNPDLYLYATYSKGFKSGGFNVGGLQDPFAPEKLANYEAGFKADLFNRRLRTNVSVFNYDYKDLQQSLVEGQNLVTRNAAKARIRGVEAEIIARPTEALTLTLNAAHLDAKFREYTNTDPVSPAMGIQDLAGNRLPNAPRYQVNAGISYAVSSSMGTFTPRAELSYVDKLYFNEFNRPEFTQPSRTLINLFLAWQSNDRNWSATAYVKNLTDKVYLSNAVASNGLQGFPLLGQYGDPLTAGLIVTRKF